MIPRTHASGEQRVTPAEATALHHQRHPPDHRARPDPQLGRHQARRKGSDASENVNAQDSPGVRTPRGWRSWPATPRTRASPEPEGIGAFRWPWPEPPHGSWHPTAAEQPRATRMHRGEHHRGHEAPPDPHRSNVKHFATATEGAHSFLPWRLLHHSAAAGLPQRRWRRPQQHQRPAAW